MSLLNKMLRDLEQRGAPAPEVIGSTAPALPLARAQKRRKAASLRTAVWGGLALIVCATLGAYGWQAERMKAYSRVAKPLGAAQFAAALPKDMVSDAVTATQASYTPPAPAAGAAGNANGTPAPATSAPAAIAANPGAIDASGGATEPVVEPQEFIPPKIVAMAAVSKPAAPKPSVAPASAAAEGAPAPQQAKSPQRASHASEPRSAEKAVEAEAIVTRKTSPEEAQLERASDFIARGRSHEAMALLTQLLGNRPDHHAARQALAALQAEIGRRDLALQTLLAGAAIDAGRFAVAAARLQAESGDNEGALITLERVPNAQRNADYEALVGGIAQRAGQHAVAAEAFARAVRSPRAPAIWWAGLGHSLDSLGQRSQAQAAFTRAVADPALPPALRSFITQRLAEIAARPAAAAPARDGAPIAALPQ